MVGEETAAMPSKPVRKPPASLAYLKTIAFASIVLGIAAIVLSSQTPRWVFGAGTFLLGVAAALLITDVWYEPKLNTKMRVILTVALPSPVSILAWLILSPAVITVVANGITGSDKDSSGKVAGIEWLPAYYETKLYMSNLSDQDYTDLAITLQTNLSIATIVQNMGAQCRIESGLLDPEYRLPGQTSVSQLNVTSFPQWHIHCDRLQHGDAINFILAVATPDPKHPTMDGGVTFWYENIPVTGVLLPASAPEWIQVLIEYRSALGRPRNQYGKYPIMAL